MKTYKYNIEGRELVIRVAAASRSISEISFGGNQLVVPEKDMPMYAGVISLALLQYEAAEIHDDESGVITVANSETQWNNPIHKLNSLNS